jgi:hypothetical protein
MIEKASVEKMKHIKKTNGKHQEINTYFVKVLIMSRQNRN